MGETARRQFGGIFSQPNGEKNKISQMPRSPRSSHVGVLTFDSSLEGFKKDILEMLTESGQVHYALIWLACSLAPGVAEMQNGARPRLRYLAEGAELEITRPNAPF